MKITKKGCKNKYEINIEKREFGKNQYTAMSEKDNQKLKEYKKNYQNTK